MRILLIGGGGREHALAWKLAQSPSLGKLYAAPGNPGIADCAELVTLDVADHAGVAAWCGGNAIDLVVVGPEAPLCAGLGDALRGAKIAVFGPDAAAARLEASKAFTKSICQRANIPTAAWVRVTDAAGADEAIARFGAPVVVKADGLAAGKGVVVATDVDEARTAARAALEDGPVVIEEFLRGEEASLFALSDGRTVVPFGSAQDHKRVGEGDVGPNTGGMGAYSPAPVLTPELEARAMAEIVAPTVATLAAAGHPYVGVLYAGLMLTHDGPKLIEYNVRFGDPECQVLMLRFDGDFAALCMAVAQGNLADYGAPRFSDEVAATVVLAAQGYPGTPKKGGAIRGIEAARGAGATVFHAGTALGEGGALVASGGRVLNVCGRAATLGQALDIAYAGVDAIDFPDGFCRRDIGWRELARLG